VKVVIDTNVIVSGLLNPYGHPAEIIRLLLTGSLKLFYDSRIISEYSEVLNRPKFKFDNKNVSIFIKEVEMAGTLVSTLPLKKSLPDPDDNMFLEAALAGNAECIVTGNTNHYPKKLCSGIRVLSPTEFMSYYQQNK
jgi:putative PIN family toxin of toxin-antitoxin system